MGYGVASPIRPCEMPPPTLDNKRLNLRWRIARYGITALYLFGGWLLFTFNLNPFSLFLGILFSILVAHFTHHTFIEETEVGRKELFPRADLLILYLLILVLKIFLASFDVAYRVITLKINPTIIRIRTRLVSDLSKTVLANSITLTPGTVTVDIEKDYLYVHWLNAKTTHSHWAGELIKGSYEPLLRRIFQ